MFIPFVQVRHREDNVAIADLNISVNYENQDDVEDARDNEIYDVNKIVTSMLISALKPRLTAIAVFPYTTECSPCSITFPGALT